MTSRGERCRDRGSNAATTPGDQHRPRCALRWLTSCLNADAVTWRSLMGWCFVQRDDLAIDTEAVREREYFCRVHSGMFFSRERVGVHVARSEASVARVCAGSMTSSTIPS